MKENQIENIKERLKENVIESLQQVILREWMDVETGWGERSDGVSLHMTIEDYNNYVRKYWDSLPKEVPYEYSKPCLFGGPTEICVSQELYLQVKKSENGIRISQDKVKEIQK